jgi:signal transduction histidine kinase
MLNLKIPNKPLNVKVDKIRINQIILNLLSNASKFTSNNGNISVQIKEEKNLIKVIISDSGIGIKSEDLEKIFEPFASIVKSTYIKGTGLGLSVSKRLVEAHGGEIWAESFGEGKGATFTFTLPKIKKKGAIKISK